MVYCLWLMTSTIVFDILDFVHLARVKLRMKRHLILELLVDMILMLTQMIAKIVIIVIT
jgi:uncharacterized membrane protein